MAEESAPEHQRLILLNRMVSRSTSHAPQEHKAPLHAAADLLGMIDRRWKAGVGIEFLGLQDRAEVDDAKRIASAAGQDYVALRDLAFEQQEGISYCKMLFEFVDENKRSFPVVDTLTRIGRELSGKKAERGATAAHVVVRLPGKQDYDDGSYRCAVESVHYLNRTDIERFLYRQLRRASIADKYLR